MGYMITATIPRDSLLGFFELDDSGKIKYSRTGISPDGVTEHSIIGQDFFELAAFRNSGELKRLFRRFVESREAADSFPFDCCFDNTVMHTKVTLTRAFQTELFPPESIVMLSIRESEN